MISVLTLTYRRHHLLEEAIESFLRQDFGGESEMVIVNDSDKVEYYYNHPKIRIINLKERFPSIGQKLTYGFSQCKYDHIYRLDDDDLLAPWALKNTWEDIVANPDYDIYRSNGHYFFEFNKLKGTAGSVNNGNVYTKNYLSRIKIPDVSFGEDFAMTYQFGAKIYESPRAQKTMIYRWGMGTFHISGLGNVGKETVNKRTDEIVANIAKEKNTAADAGLMELHPHFNEEYYNQII